VRLALGAAIRDERFGRRNALAGCLRQWRCDGGRWRQCRQRHGAADAAAAIEADFAVVFGGRGRLLTGDDAVADDATRNGGRFGRSPRGAETRDQARERNRISGRQRDHALPQRPLSEEFAQARSPRCADNNTLRRKKFPDQRESAAGVKVEISEKA
jgi:hypothetical protein